MNINRWPPPVRWLLFLPVAVLASMLTHFLLSLPVSGDHWIEVPLSNHLEAVWRDGLMRFLEPWSFVAAAAFVAPRRKIASLSTATTLTLLFITILVLQLAMRSVQTGSLLLLLRAAAGIAGTAAGAVTGIRIGADAKAAASREHVSPEFIELLLKLDPKSNG